MIDIEGGDDSIDPEQTSSISNSPLSAPELEAPSLSTKVFKDECMFCFHSSVFKGGIYVCLQHFVGLCENHVRDYSQFKGSKYFLRIQKFKIQSKEVEEPKDKVQRLCITAEKEDTEEKESVVVAPDFMTDIPINEQYLDGNLYHVVQAVSRHASASYQNAVDTGVSEWDGSERKVLSNAEDLVQLNVKKTIPYSGWQCEEPGCDLTENLWLNLSDGKILCGRAQYISEDKMSQGNSHARIHAEMSGFAVLVKLGTIHDGDADVYSYAENESVWDPLLKKHLEHFGLDIDKFEKTEKSTLELELDLNQKWEWSRCQEDGVTLENVYGGGFTGLINIGSSCYINSVIQTLLLDPVFVKAYTKQFNTQIDGSQLVELYEDFNFQLVRLIHSLVSGEYAKEGFEHNGIKPTQFRRVAGRGHSEFSTARQQDAGEYITHLFGKIEETFKGEPNPVDNYRFKLVTVFRDNASQKVHYITQPNFILPLLIPKDNLVTKPMSLDDLTEAIGPLPKSPRFNIDLTNLLDYYKLPQLIEDFVSPVTKENKGAEQSCSFGTFPKFLLIQVNRYEYDDHGQPKKLDVDVNVPDELDLFSLRFEGPKPDEELLPECDVPASLRNKNEKASINQDIVQQIVDMGFPHRNAELAVQYTQSACAEEALDWLLAHMDDPMLHEIPESAAESPASKQEPVYKDGTSKYKLRGFITHMGSSPHSGHYVCHLLREGKWYLYNDEKVAVSQNPPKSLGYIYLYEQAE